MTVSGNAAIGIEKGDFGLLNVVHLSAGTGAASQNTANLQAALNKAGHVYAVLQGGGDAYINAALSQPSDTWLELAPGTNLRASAIFGYLLINKNYNSAVKTVTTLTVAADAVTHRYVVTAACTGHGLAAGSYVLIKGDTTDQYVGVHRVVTVADANTFTFYVTSQTALSNGSGTITAAAADANLKLSGGSIDYNAAVNGGSGLALMGAIYNKVGNLEIFDQTIKDVPKYGYYPGNCYGVRVRNLYAVTNSAVVQFIGPARDIHISDVRGWGGDDFIAFVATNGGGFGAYDLPDCNGELVNFTCEHIHARGGNNAVAVYPGAGYAFRGIRIRDITTEAAVSNHVTISTVAGATAALPQDIQIDGIYGDCANQSVVIGRGDDFGTIQSLTIRNVYPTSYKKNHYVLVNDNWTIQSLKIADSFAAFDLSARSCNVVHSSASNINFAEAQNVRTDTINASGFGSRLFTGGGYAEISVHDCNFAGTGFFGLWDTSSTNVTPVIWANNLRLSAVASLLQTARPCKLRAAKISSHGTFGNGGMLHCFQAGVAYSIRLRDIDIAANSVFSSTAGTITFSGDETAKVDVTLVQRADGASLYNSNTAAGTLAQAGVVDCLGTAANSWKLRGNNSLTY